MTATTTPQQHRLIHLDAVGGIAGDMFVAALLDAYPDLTGRVMADVAAVLPTGCGTARLTPGFSSGLRCMRFGLQDVDSLPDGAKGGHDAASHHHHGARFTDLRALIQCADLSPGTHDRAIAILTHLAQAESAIHGVTPEDVHFHEVGDWDSLMDVVAAGSIAAALAPAIWTVSDLPLGGGLVRTQHGLLPIPAPATVQLLTGFGWRDDGVPGERVTPTGAAILRALVDPAAARPATARLAGSGTGAGDRTMPGLPNILRATVFDPASAGSDTFVEIVSCDIDDMTGEEIGLAADRLRATDGVIDLTIQTLTGKKGRPVSRFEIVAASGCRAWLPDIIFSETSTLGVRWRSETRAILPRSAGHSAGLRVKTAIRPDGQSTIKAESDDLSTISGLAQRRAAARAAETASADDHHE